MQSLVKTSLPQSAFTCSKLTVETLEQHLVLVFLLLTLNCDVSLFYVLYSSLEEVGCGLRKSPLFSATLTYLTFKKKKKKLFCIILHVACDPCFQK